MLGELSTYSLSDFLMFTPDIYYRLFERYNAALWPTQWLAGGLGVWMLVQARCAPGGEGRALALLLALAWGLVAWAFHWRLYAEINLAAPYLAAGFALQGVLLAAAAAAGIRFRLDNHGTAWAGLALLLFAVLVHPFIGPLTGRAWSGIELFLLAPDPTAAGTVGLLLMAPRPFRWPLLPLPLLALTASALTYRAMDSHAGLITPAATAIVLIAAAALAAKRRLTTP